MIDKFFQAACDGDINFLSRYPDHCRYATYCKGATALNFAALHGRLEIARWPLEHGAEIDALDDNVQMTLVAWAHEKEHHSMVTVRAGCAERPYSARHRTWRINPQWSNADVAWNYFSASEIPAKLLTPL